MEVSDETVYGVVAGVITGLAFLSAEVGFWKDGMISLGEIAGVVVCAAWIDVMVL